MRRSRPVIHFAVCVVIAGAVLSGGARREVRGLWVVRTALASTASIAAMVAAARDAGVNTLLVQVRGRGDAYYASRLEPRAAALAGQPASFDPLAVVLRQGHEAGLSVHAWLNVNLVADAGGPPAAPAHIVNRHPEWLMVPMDLARSVSDPRDRRFVPALAAWTRRQGGRVEGLFLSPIPAAAGDHLARVVEELAARYAIDGVHLDYVRYPAASFDYSRSALRAFAADVAGDLSPEVRSALERRQRANPLVWTQTYPRRWETFRRERLTALVKRLRGIVLQHRPRAVVSAAVVPDAPAAVGGKFQDWPTWAADGLLDAVCPMTYATSDALFNEQLEAVRAAARGRPVWAGIGAYRLTGEQALRQIQEARLLGVDGVLLFSYDSLVDPARGPDNLLRLGAQAFGQ